MPSQESIDIESRLVAVAQGPAKVSGDAGSVEQPALSELIAVAKYQAGKDAASSARRGLRFSRLIPDGTVQRCR